jgi:hypothetical protein
MEDRDIGEAIELVELVELVELGQLVASTETSGETIVVVELRLKVGDDEVVFENWRWKCWPETYQLFALQECLWI